MEDFDKEIEHIETRFKRRALAPATTCFGSALGYMLSERDQQIGELLKNYFGPLEDRSILDVGAGSGANVTSLLNLGFKAQNYFANELVPERAEQLIHHIPRNQIHVGDIRTFKPARTFDVVFVATVFTSILNSDLRRSIADHIWSLTGPGGVVLWYDFKFEMPWNKETVGVPFREVKLLFPNAASFERRSVTLFRPIARRIGRFYAWANFSFLRSHEIVRVAKP